MDHMGYTPMMCCFFPAYIVYSGAGLSGLTYSYFRVIKSSSGAVNARDASPHFAQKSRISDGNGREIYENGIE